VSVSTVNANAGGTGTICDVQGNVAPPAGDGASSGAGNAVNQFVGAASSFGPATNAQQSVPGAATPSTPGMLQSNGGGVSTPALLTATAIPNARVQDNACNSSAGAAVGSAGNPLAPDGTNPVDYYYLGLGQSNGASSPQPGLDLSLGPQGNDRRLDRIDQFSLATDQVFAETGGAMLDEIPYGGDVAGNGLWQAESTPASDGTDLTDQLQRQLLDELTGAPLGTLDSSPE
jgi:hypothetical protein